MSEENTRAKVIERLELETRQRGFVEYPKMLHHPDGSVKEVTNRREEERDLSAGWCPTPDDAIAEKKKRDEAEAKRLAEKIAAEAKAAEKK